MKADSTLPEVPTLSPSIPDDESPTAKVRRLRAVKKKPYAWDPYEVWRTRVKPSSPDPHGAAKDK